MNSLQPAERKRCVSHRVSRRLTHIPEADDFEDGVILIKHEEGILCQ